MAVVRSASATWSGNLTEGGGSVSSTSGRISEMPISWSARTSDPSALGGPEELLAAAHASCFSMALSNTLYKDGFTAERLDVTAEVTADKLEVGWTVVSSHLTVTGRVPGTDQDAFASAAERAKDGCPISRALQGNVALSVTATLEA